MIELIIDIVPTVWRLESNKHHTTRGGSSSRPKSLGANVPASPKNRFDITIKTWEHHSPLPPSYVFTASRSLYVLQAGSLIIDTTLSILAFHACGDGGEGGVDGDAAEVECANSTDLTKRSEWLCGARSVRAVLLWGGVRGGKFRCIGLIVWFLLIA